MGKWLLLMLSLTLGGCANPGADSHGYDGDISLHVERIVSESETFMDDCTYKTTRFNVILT